jgi:hypothetical protein
MVVNGWRESINPICGCFCRADGSRLHGTAGAGSFGASRCHEHAADHLVRCFADGRRHRPGTATRDPFPPPRFASEGIGAFGRKRRRHHGVSTIPLEAAVSGTGRPIVHPARGFSPPLLARVFPVVSIDGHYAFCSHLLSPMNPKSPIRFSAHLRFDARRHPSPSGQLV